MVSTKLREPAKPWGIVRWKAQLPTALSQGSAVRADVLQPPLLESALSFLHQ